MQIFANPHNKAREAKPEMCLFFFEKKKCSGRLYAGKHG